MSTRQKLSLTEKAGYAAGDAAANFVFMTVILFQTTFYTDVFGIGAEAAAVILLGARLWDAIVDPIVGALADRTNTRWGKFRPWIAATALPWCCAMILAFSTPKGWSMDAKIAYAAITNVLLMSIYSMNNIPYAALGGVMTGNGDERTSLNSVRFVFVIVAQFVVGGLTLPLVAKFASGHGKQYGWQATMTVWAGICLALFVINVLTTRERIAERNETKRDIKGDLKVLFNSNPWIVVCLVTIVYFSLLSFRGGAMYEYYHHYADGHSMYRFLRGIGLGAPTAGAGGSGIVAVLDGLGLLVRERGNDPAQSNVADVFNSLVNMLNMAVTILGICASPALSRRFGKKAVALAGFILAGVATTGFYFIGATDVAGMLVLTIVSALLYAPTIPLLWAIYADVADYCEWTSGRRCTGVVFATVCFALKCGLALGSAAFLWAMAGFFGYDPHFPGSVSATYGYRVCNGMAVGIMFLVCGALLAAYRLNRDETLRMAHELPRRRVAAPSGLAAGGDAPALS